MIGYFGAIYFGGAVEGDPSTTPAPTQNTRIAADGAVAVDWDVQVESNPPVVDNDETGDEIGTASESVITSGLGVGGGGGGPVVVSDTADATESRITTGLGTPPPPVNPPLVVVTTSTIRFLDGVGGNLRMDLDNGPWRVLKDGTDTPPPPMEDQRSSSMIADGELVTASAYRNRTVRLTLLLNAANQAAAYREIQLLQRELDRPTNVLYYQPDDSQPGWYFLTYRGPDVTTDFDYGLSTYRFELEIEAEPFAIGDEIQLGTFTIPHNPAGTPGLWMDFGGIRGDVDTPLFIRSTDIDLAAQTLAISTRRRGNPANVPIYRQGEDATLTRPAGSGSGVLVGTDSSNGSVTHVYMSEPNTLRLSGRFPGETGASPDWQGTYRVFARMRRVAASGPITVQIATGTSSLADRNQAVTVDTSDWTHYDLGLVQLPPGNTGHRAGYGSAYSAEGGMLHLYAQRTTGSSDLEIDYIVTLPADEDYAFVQMPPHVAGGTHVLDGPNGTVYLLGSSGGLRGYQGAHPYVDGTLPTVSPLALTNRVYFLADIAPNEVGPTMNTAYTVTVSYWPRYLVVRPSAS